MPAWIIKSETSDPNLALEIVEDRRNKGYSAWIEDENGAAVDEQSLRAGGDQENPFRPIDLKGPLFVVASVFAGFVILYLVGLWMDHY